MKWQYNRKDKFTYSHYSNGYAQVIRLESRLWYWVVYNIHSGFRLISEVYGTSDSKEEAMYVVSDVIDGAEIGNKRELK